jgi:hypothetical protein
MTGGAVALSAIVISRNDAATIARGVGSVVEQACAEPFEVIVVTSGDDGTADIVRERFPAVTLIALPRAALPGEARNAGLSVARGEFISFPGSHVELPPGSLAARLRAHRRGFDMVTGATLNGTLTRAGWAAYFLDHSRNLPHAGAAVLRRAPAHCSYSHAALRRVGGFPEGVRAGEDTAVNAELYRLGYRALRDPQVVLVHHTPCRTPATLLRHHFARGQGEGATALREAAARGVMRLTRLARFEPNARIARIGGRALGAASPYRGVFGRVFPLVWLGAWAAWAGIGAAGARRPSRAVPPAVSGRWSAGAGSFPTRWSSAPAAPPARTPPDATEAT